MNKPKIFCYPTTIWGGGDVATAAIAEDGTYLAGHLSSSMSFAKHDIGVTSKWKHKHYESHYPDGFEVVWVSPEEVRASSNHEFEAAFTRNQTQGETEDE